MDTDLKIERILQKINKLPTIPVVAVKILKAIQEENKSLNDLATILSSDAPMSAEILKIVNSPRYGLSNRVNSLPFAISLLGTNTVKYIALSFSIVRDFRKKSKCNYSDLWKDSILTAVACRIIAEKTAPEIKDEMFAIGLLHDMGRLIILENFATEYSDILSEEERNSRNNISLPLHDLEKKTLGFSHACMGAALVKKWGFNPAFYYPVKYHHCPGLLPSDVSQEIKVNTIILSFASLLKDFFTLKNKNKILKDIELYADSSELIFKEQLDDVKARIDEESKPLFSILEVDYNDTDNYYADMFEMARNELIKMTDDVINESFEQQQKLIDNLIVYANYDELTGLYNYRRFYEAFNLEYTRIKRYNLQCALIFIDIDFFKAINDNYGHIAGDKVLKNIADVLVHSLRESDIICRYGGEEFAIILPETNKSEAVQTAERLREAVKNSAIDYEGRLIKVTISLGVKVLDAKNLNMPSLSYIRSADEALYNAKKLGRDRVVVAEN